MTTRTILTLIFAAFVLAEARWHTQKREITQPICGRQDMNHSKITCNCDAFDNRIESVKCYLTVNGVLPTDSVWDTFEQLKSARKIILTSTIRDVNLEYIPSKALRYLEYLEKLDVNHGHIERIQKDAFLHQKNIVEIDVRDSQVKILEIHAFAHHAELKAVKLDNNNIEEINRDVFVSLPMLEKLFLTQNQITTIHDKAFVHLSNLKELLINVNKLFSLNTETFAGLKNLRKLDLSYNNLEVIGDKTFYPLKNLLSLDLRGNKLQMLDDLAFNGLVKMKHLFLSHNKLANFSNDKAFIGLESLTKLDLKSNEIINWNANIMKFIANNFLRNDSDLDVEDNLFKCDCKLDWFMQLKNQTLSKHLENYLNNLKCYPDDKLRDEWNNVVENDKNSQLDDENSNGAKTEEYDYYDDSQLNGQLFYTDVRDILNCDEKNKSNKMKKNTVPSFKTELNPKPAAPETLTSENDNISHNRITTPAERIRPMPSTTSSKPVQEGFNSKVLDLSIDETTPKPNDVPTVENHNFENEVTQSKPKYTTARQSTVSAKPVSVYENMASDEAKPDRLKSQRSLQAEYKDMPGNAFRISGCATLISLICFRLLY